MRSHSRRRGCHQGLEGRWEAMRTLPSGPFCPFDSRRMSLGDLAAGCRYTAKNPLTWPLPLEPGEYDAIVTGANYRQHLAWRWVLSTGRVPADRHQPPWTERRELPEAQALLRLVGTASSCPRRYTLRYSD